MFICLLIGEIDSQDSPPEYPLENVQAAIALVTGKGDRLADPEDVQHLRSRISAAVVFDYELPDESFAHLDFVIGSYVADILHVPVVSLLAEYNNVTP